MHSLSLTHSSTQVYKLVTKKEQISKKAQDGANQLTSGNKSFVGDASTLGQTSGTRSIHDTVQVGWLSRVRLNGVILTELAKFLERDDLQIRVFGPEGLELATLGKDRSVVDNDGFDGRLLDGLRGGLKELRIDVHSATFGLNKRVLNTAGSKCIVGGDNGDGLGGSCVGSRDPSDATRRGVRNQCLVAGASQCCTYLVVPKT
jgi:hypothetical protein